MSGWTPSCPAPDDILRLAAGGPITASLAGATDHILHCAFCLAAYTDTRKALGAAEPVRVTEADGLRAVRWRKIAGPALAFATGAAVLAVVVWAAALRPGQLHEQRLQAALAAERRARHQEAAVSAQTIAALRAQTTAPRAADVGEAAALETAVLSRKLDVPAAVRLLASTTRGGGAGDDGVRLVAPAETFVLTDRPVLAADVPPGAAGLRASLTDSAGLEVAVAPSSAGAWRPVKALRRGEPYQWSVECVVRDRRVVSRVAAFQVLDAVSASFVLQAMKRYREHPLLLAVLLARAGLLDEAGASLDRALRLHPSDPTAMALRADLHRLRPQRSL